LRSDTANWCSASRDPETSAHSSRPCRVRGIGTRPPVAKS
jgi:hypothetical protein